MQPTFPRRALTSLIASALVVPAAFVAPASVGAQTERHPVVTASLESLASVIEACAEKDAADDDVANGVQLGFRFCDDGATTDAGAAGVPVPVAYHPGEGGDDYTGLPAPATEEEIAAAVERDDL